MRLWEILEYGLLGAFLGDWERLSRTRIIKRIDLHRINLQKNFMVLESSNTTVTKFLRRIHTHFFNFWTQFGKFWWKFLWRGLYPKIWNWNFYKGLKLNKFILNWKHFRWKYGSLPPWKFSIFPENDLSARKKCFSRIISGLLRVYSLCPVQRFS